MTNEERNRRIARIRRRHMRMKQSAVVAAAVFVALTDEERDEVDVALDLVVPS